MAAEALATVFLVGTLDSECRDAAQLHEAVRLIQQRCLRVGGEPSLPHLKLALHIVAAECDASSERAAPLLELRCALMRCAQQSTQRVPASHDAVLHHLRALSDDDLPFLSVSMMEQHCAELGVAADSARRVLAACHAAGTVTWFHDVEALADALLLEPLWLSRVVSLLLAARDSLAVRNGLVTHAALASLWQPLVAADNVARVVCLLQLFELAFACGDVHFVPLLLPDELPADAPRIDRFAVRRVAFSRHWTLRVPPRRLLHRIIAAVLRIRRGRHFAWQRGVVLARDDATLVVEWRDSSHVLALTVRSGNDDAIDAAQQLFCLGAMLVGDELASAALADATARVPCAHCESTVAFDTLVKVAIAGELATVCGGGGHLMRVANAAPDLHALPMISKCELAFGDTLGRGSFGTVHAAQLRDGGRTVAVKQPIDVSAFASVAREALLLRLAACRNVTAFVGVCRRPLALVVEFMNAGSLHEYLHSEHHLLKTAADAAAPLGVVAAEPGAPAPRRTFIPWPVRARIALHVASALATLHGCSDVPIVHGDVKSPNVLLHWSDGELHARLCDFDKARQTHVVVERIVDCPVWLAPEAMRGVAFSTSADIYSFGVVLFELVTQQQFFGSERFRRAIEDCVRRGERPPLR